MDTKEYATRTVYAVAILYGIACALRKGTRYQAKRSEWGLVAVLLMGAAIILPILFGAVHS